MPYQALACRIKL